MIFAENPMGVGENNYSSYTKKLVEDKKIDPFVLRFSHPHSEIFASLVEQGIIGLVGVLYLLLFPVILSVRVFTSKTSNEIKKVSVILFIISLYYFLYSFTNGVFDHHNSSLFYLIIVSLLIAKINISHE